MKGIIFSAPMALALIQGRKTQTRRALKHQPAADDGEYRSRGFSFSLNCGVAGISVRAGLRRISDGDLFTQPVDFIVDETYYVREPIQREPPNLIKYAADGRVRLSSVAGGGKWRWKNSGLPARFMPKELSRMSVKIVSAKIERLHNISAADAHAEGIDETSGAIRAIESYLKFWDHINAKRAGGIYASDRNPWVVAYTLELVG